MYYPTLQGSPQPWARTVCQGYREIDIREFGWIPLRWFLWWWGWPCLKVNVKGLFVPAQQPGMRERGLKTDLNTALWLGTQQRAALSNRTPNFDWRVQFCSSSLSKWRLFIFITSNKTQAMNQVVGTPPHQMIQPASQACSDDIQFTAKALFVCLFT